MSSGHLDRCDRYRTDFGGFAHRPAIYTDGVIALVVVSSVVGVLQAGAILLLTKKISRPITPLFDWVESWRLVRQATPIFLNMLVIVLYIRLDAFLLSVLSTPRPSCRVLNRVSYRRWRLSQIPGIMMTTSFAFLTSSASNLPIFNRRVTQLWELALTFGALISVPSYPISGIVMSIIGGHSYATGGRTLSLLLLGTSVTVCKPSGGRGAFRTGKQNLLLAFSAVNLCINGGMNLVLIPRYGANGAAISYLDFGDSGSRISIVWLVHLGAITLRVRALLSLVVMAGGVLLIGILAMNLSGALRVVWRLLRADSDWRYCSSEKSSSYQVGVPGRRFASENDWRNIEEMDIGDRCWRKMQQVRSWG